MNPEESELFENFIYILGSGFKNAVGKPLGISALGKKRFGGINKFAESGLSCAAGG